jgi:hypothetical protein
MLTIHRRRETRKFKLKKSVSEAKKYSFNNTHDRPPFVIVSRSV